MREAFQKETRRARMVFAGARPEDPIRTPDPIPGDAGIIGRAARRRASQFLEDFARLGRERIARSPVRREPGEDLNIGPDSCRRFRCPLPQNDAALHIRHRALLFGPLRRRQNDVGSLGCFRQKEIRHHKKIESVQTILDVASARRGDRYVRSENQQGTHAALASERVEHFISGNAGARQDRFRLCPRLRR